MKNKVKNRKRVNLISLGSLILGVFFISWAMIHIQKETAPTVYTENTNLTSNNVIQQNAFKSNSFVPVETSYPISTPNHDDILYPIRPLEGDTIGNLTIPALKQIIPIIHGTDEDELEKGIGHFSQSVLPGENNNSVLSGHRDTVFAKLGELKLGNTLIVETSAGIFTYKISAIRIVHKEDLTIIVPTDHAVLTVITCYPFHFIGAAPDRYILTADLI
ncbi:class D sortase [Paenibacillus sp. LC-T2]|uniref:Class D sortase n=2 Tax=Paenibacillus monticola TaxID=2666075 RepID=A0A7X2L1A0_9BACL|nr:class D sortase [Paenibacillus monticola]